MIPINIYLRRFLITPFSDVIREFDCHGTNQGSYCRGRNSYIHGSNMCTET